MKATTQEQEDIRKNVMKLRSEVNKYQKELKGYIKNKSYDEALKTIKVLKRKLVELKSECEKLPDKSNVSLVRTIIPTLLSFFPFFIGYYKSEKRDFEERKKYKEHRKHYEDELRWRQDRIDLIYEQLEMARKHPLLENFKIPEDIQVKVDADKKYIEDEKDTPALFTRQIKRNSFPRNVPKNIKSNGASLAFGAAVSTGIHIYNLKQEKSFIIKMANNLLAELAKLE